VHVIGLCRIIGADARPNWQEQPPSDTLTLSREKGSPSRTGGRAGAPVVGECHHRTGRGPTHGKHRPQWENSVFLITKSTQARRRCLRTAAGLVWATTHEKRMKYN
jgi:hypothetical protein